MLLGKGCRLLSGENSQMLRRLTLAPGQVLAQRRAALHAEQEPRRRSCSMCHGWADPRQPRRLHRLAIHSPAPQPRAPCIAAHNECEPGEVTGHSKRATMFQEMHDYKSRFTLACAIIREWSCSYSRRRLHTREWWDVEVASAPSGPPQGGWRVLESPWGTATTLAHRTMSLDASRISACISVCTKRIHNHPCGRSSTYDLRGVCV